MLPIMYCRSKITYFVFAHPWLLYPWLPQMVAQMLDLVLSGTQKNTWRKLRDKKLQTGCQQFFSLKNRLRNLLLHKIHRMTSPVIAYLVSQKKKKSSTKKCGSFVEILWLWNVNKLPPFASEPCLKHQKNYNWCKWRETPQDTLSKESNDWCITSA